MGTQYAECFREDVLSSKQGYKTLTVTPILQKRKPSLKTTMELARFMQQVDMDLCLVETGNLDMIQSDTKSLLISGTP